MQQTMRVCLKGKRITIWLASWADFMAQKTAQHFDLDGVMMINLGRFEVWGRQRPPLLLQIQV